MNTALALLLGIIVIFLIYYLYISYFNLVILVPYANLNAVVADVDVSKINLPSSTRYAYGVWIYVRTWSTAAAKKWIYKLKDSTGKLLGGLYLDKNTFTLRFDISKDGGTSFNTVTVTDNFPLQKWTYVVVSVDNNIIDFYLDGSLKISKKIDTPAFSVPNGNLGVGDGRNTYDILLARLRRWDEPVDPQTVWTTNQQGTGLSSQDEYSVSVAVLNNNIPQTQVKLY